MCSILLDRDGIEWRVRVSDHPKSDGFF